jgi:hypothetical protein
VVSKEAAFAGFEAEGEAVVRHKFGLGKYDGGYNDEYSLLAAEWCGIKDQERAKSVRRADNRQRLIGWMISGVIAMAAVAFTAYLRH